MTREQVLDVDAAVEFGGEHPLGRAIPGVVPGIPPVDDIEAVVGAELGRGKGGRPTLLDRRGRSGPGVLAGDINATALHVGIDQVHAEPRPEDKTRLVADLRTQRRTTTVDDTVNDGPAPTPADPGMAMDTDVPIETADIALMDDDRGTCRRHSIAPAGPVGLPLRNVVLSLGVVIGRTPLARFGVFGLPAAVLVQEAAGIALIAHGAPAGLTKSLAACRAATSRPSVEAIGVFR